MLSRDKTKLFRPFEGQLSYFESMLRHEGLPFYFFNGLRTWEQQNGLYAQGRTTPGAIVTNAQAGDSIHNYGLAADYVLDGDTEKPGIQWSWQTKGDILREVKAAEGATAGVRERVAAINAWRRMGELAKKAGLEWGGDWRRPDLPHVQNRFGLNLVEIKEQFIESGRDYQTFWQSLKL